MGHDIVFELKRQQLKNVIHIKIMSGLSLQLKHNLGILCKTIRSSEEALNLDGECVMLSLLPITRTPVSHAAKGL